MISPQATVSSTSKKTNSLAFSRTDCHTCAASGQPCDRRRPRCSTCLSQGRTCGGFATPLSWATKRMWTDNPSIGDAATAPATQSTTAPTLPSNASAGRDFRFIVGPSKPRKRRKTSHAPSRKGQNSFRHLSADENKAPASVDGSRLLNPDEIGNLPDVQATDALGEGLPQQTQCLGHDTNQLTSVSPDITGPMPLLDLDPGFISCEVTGNGNMAAHATQFTAMKTAARSPTNDGNQWDSLAQNLDYILPGSRQLDHPSSTSNDWRLQVLDIPSPSLAESAAVLPGVIGNHQTDLLRMCKAWSPKCRTI